MKKIDRLGSLFITFLNNPAGISFSRIRDSIPSAYEGDPQTSRRKFERDKEELKAIGMELAYYPPGSILPSGREATDHIYVPGEDVELLPDIDLTRDEAALLAASLFESINRYTTTDPDRARLLQNAASRMLYKNPTAIQFNLVESTGQIPATGSDNSTQDSSSLFVITESVRKRNIVSFEYPSADLTYTERLVKGRGLITHRGRWCLVGEDSEKNAIRYFYVDKIKNPVLQDDTFPADPDFKLSHHSLHPLALHKEEKQLVNVVISEQSEEIFHEFITGAPSGICREAGNNEYRIHTTNPEALFIWILIHPGSIEKIGPAIIHDRFVTYHRELISMYSKAISGKAQQ